MKKSSFLVSAQDRKRVSSYFNERFNKQKFLHKPSFKVLISAGWEGEDWEWAGIVF